MLNLIVNIIFGYGLETLYFGYAFNKIKGVKYKSTYLLFLISYIVSFLLQKFTYNNLYLTYIMIAALFYLLYAIVHKEFKQITNFFLILNLILISSIIMAIPILILGYNAIYLNLNIILNIILLILFIKLPLDKYYKSLIQNWNRTTHNKIKSVTMRNFTMIFIYTFVTLINMFVNGVFMSIYQKLL